MNCIEKRIPDNHEVRIFDKVLDKIDIHSILDKYSNEGGSAYHPAIMLKVLIYGYHQGIRSSRKLSKACLDSFAMMFLAEGLKIKFRAIADFRVRFRKELPEICKEVIQLIYETTEIEIRLPYMDGVKLKADASNKKSKTKSEWKEEIERIENDIQKHFEETIVADKEEDKILGPENNGFEIPEAEKNSIDEVIDNKIKQSNDKKYQKRLKKDEEKVKEIMEARAKEKAKQNSQKAESHTSGISVKNESKNKVENTANNPTESIVHIKEEINPPINVSAVDVKNLEETVAQTDTLLSTENNLAEKIACVEKEINSSNNAPLVELKNLEVIVTEAEPVPSPENTETEKKSDKEIMALCKKYLNIYGLLKANWHAEDDVKLNLTDYDARFMKINGKIMMGYNNQFTTQNQIPIAMFATQAQNDQHLFIKNILMAQKNLPQADIEGGVSDAGYNNGKTLKAVVERGIEAFIPSGRADHEQQNKTVKDFDIRNFIYNEDEDVWKCQQARTLEFFKNEFKGEVQYSVYKCTPANCVMCPDRDKCFSTKDDSRLGYKTIKLDKFAVYRNEMEQKMATTEAKEIYKYRKIEPEPVFGNMKHNKGIRSFMVRGLPKVNGELQIIGMALQIQKLANWAKVPENMIKFAEKMNQRN